MSSNIPVDSSEPDQSITYNIRRGGYSYNSKFITKFDKFILTSQQDQSYFDNFVNDMLDKSKLIVDYPRALYDACFTVGIGSSIKTVKTLIELKYDVNPTDICLGPLISCCIGMRMNDKNTDCFQCLKLLVEANADVHQLFYRQENKTKVSFIDLILDVEKKQDSIVDINSNMVKSIIYLSNKGVKIYEEPQTVHIGYGAGFYNSYNNHFTNNGNGTDRVSNRSVKKIVVDSLIKLDLEHKKTIRTHVVESIKLYLYYKTDLCQDLINEIVKFL
jgi:hypothetical protein